MFLVERCLMGSRINWIHLNYRNVLYFPLENFSCSSVEYGYTDSNQLAKQARKLKTLMSGSKHHLCSTHVLGNVPHVRFVKDRLQSDLKQVEYLLSIADFGPEDPTEHTSMQNQAEGVSKGAQQITGLNDSLENVDNENTKAQKLDHNSGNDATECIADPSIGNDGMRMDIYGLRQDEMMRQVVQNMSRATAEHRKFPGEVDVPKELWPRDFHNYVDSRPVMNIKEYLDQKKRLLKTKHKSRKQQLIEMRNSQIMEENFQNEEYLDRSEEDYEYEDFLSEEDSNYTLEHYNDRSTK